MIDDYFRALQALIAASPLVRASSVAFDRRSNEIGAVRGDLTFTDASRLHFREFVHQAEGAPAERYTYAYHYQRADNTLIFRYDNSEHFPNLLKRRLGTPARPEGRVTLSEMRLIVT